MGESWGSFQEPILTAESNPNEVFRICGGEEKYCRLRQPCPNSDPYPASTTRDSPRMLSRDPFKLFLPQGLPIAPPPSGPARDPWLLVTQEKQR